MAWIESHQELRNHPKTLKLCRLLDISLAQGIGHLHMLWWWVLEYAEAGDLSGFDLEDIATAGGWEGDPEQFIVGLASCGIGGASGFLERDGQSLKVHDWWECAGKLVAKRRADAERKRRDRRPTPPPDAGQTVPYSPVLSNGHPTDIQRTAQDVAGNTNSNRNSNPTVRSSSASKGGLGGETNAADESEEARIAVILEEEPAPLRLKAISKTVEQWPAADMEALAIDYMLWQASLEPKKRHRNRIQGWQNAVSRKHDWPQFQRKPQLSLVPSAINRTVPLDFASVPEELMPDAHPDVPHYMQLMDRALRWYVSEKGKTQWPHQYGVFRCAPAVDQCDESRLVLLTDEPPDAAEQMTKFLRILARGFEARVESRWAS